MAWIIPLLKADKSPSDLASFRPVSLTSCIVKLLERLIANRIYTMAEQKGWLHAAQAGFRKGRSCEDQITRVIQSINDGLNSVPMKRSVLVLLDFSKAYDTVWRQKLLVTLDEIGLPSYIPSGCAPSWRTDRQECGLTTRLVVLVQCTKASPKAQSWPHSSSFAISIRLLRNCPLIL